MSPVSDDRNNAKCRKCPYRIRQQGSSGRTQDRPCCNAAIEVLIPIFPKYSLYGEICIYEGDDSVPDHFIEQECPFDGSPPIIIKAYLWGIESFDQNRILKMRGLEPYQLDFSFPSSSNGGSSDS
jgi:hypothetical protein